MTKQLFTPKQFDLPAHLILVPQFWAKDYFIELDSRANTSIELIQSQWLLFDHYTLITGFLGYPHLLTILEFIKNLRQKEIYFLGTAGSLDERFNQPLPLWCQEIHSTQILDHFAPHTSYSMKTPENTPIPKVKGVTTDIIQRETDHWLREQIQKGISFVEMEIFPLRVYLGKPFHAMVVTSDLLRESGIDIFKDKKSLQRQFVNSYQLITQLIQENIPQITPINNNEVQS